MKQSALIIFYDNYCPNCTMFAKGVEKFDWLKLIQIKQLRNPLHTDLFPNMNLELAKQQMASFGTKWHYGFNSIFYIFVRLPLFWLFVPFFFLLKVTGLGQLIYVELALKRKIIPLHCDSESCEI
jgi:predicted DCC family thiol-disulfide oxidoreductase YuxK